MASALHAGRRDAFDQQPLEEEEEEEDRHHRQGRHREQAAPVRFARRIDEGAQAELDRVVLHVVQVDQRREEIVPGPDEGEDCGGRQHRRRKRQDDLPVDAPGAAAVHHRRLVELARDAAEELHHQEDEEGVDARNFGTTSGRMVSTQPRLRNSTYCGISATW